MNVPALAGTASDGFRKPPGRQFESARRLRFFSSASSAFALQASLGVELGSLISGSSALRARPYCVT